EPFRPRSADDDTLADWFHQADRNNDGVIDAAELRADAERFFATLDTNHDGQIDPDELSEYESDIAPDVQVNSRTRRAPGQALPTAVKAPSDDELTPQLEALRPVLDAHGRPKRKRDAVDPRIGNGLPTGP